MGFEELVAICRVAVTGDMRHLDAVRPKPPAKARHRWWHFTAHSECQRCGYIRTGGGPVPPCAGATAAESANTSTSTNG